MSREPYDAEQHLIAVMEDVVEGLRAVAAAVEALPEELKEAIAGRGPSKGDEQ